MEIIFTQEEEDIILEVAAHIAATKGIDPEQALKELMYMGVNAWREMDFWSVTKSNSRHDQ